MNQKSEEYLLHPKDPIIIQEVEKSEAEIKQRKQELAREFWFKKKGYRKHIR